jgi:transcriptional regulator with XRE-family HTH domain
VTAPSNEAVGRWLGVSHATISRYRSGDRFPEMDVLARIAEKTGWTMDDQYAAYQKGTYPSEFAKRVSGHPSLGAMVENAASDLQGGSR